MNRGRRYGKWLRRLGYAYLGYLLIALVFLGINPVEATVNFGEIWQVSLP